MTAEILIMNRLAVALAADSALTIGSGRKIFNSSNKLFALSKHHPVGIMIYGYPELSGIPFETIIKLFREERKTKSCETISEYFNCFIEFISNKKELFMEEYQEFVLRIICKNFLEHLINEYFLLIDEKIKTAEDINKLSFEKVLNEHLKEDYESFKEIGFIETYNQEKMENLVTLYDDIISEEINQIKEINFTKKQKKIIKELVIGFYVKKEIEHDFITGIVIAGFGETEIFPAYKKVTIKGVINNCLILDKLEETKIGVDTYSNIRSFAQTDMVQIFMNGLHPNHRLWLHGFLGEIFTNYPKKIIEELPLQNNSLKKAIIKKFTKESMKIYDEFLEKETDIIKAHYQPILDIVDVLPKDELASMAESLVNLTMFKRKVSAQVESVGGPIDVAVISKGDGFIWIKRKHYFKAELNPSFLKQHYTNIKE